MSARLSRACALVLLTGLALLLGSAPAWAHSGLDGSDPAEGTSLASAPQAVSLKFDEPVQPGFTTVTVIGPDGVDYRSGTTSEVDSTVSAPVRALGPAGAYQIGYRVVSADGHPIAGSVTFTLTTAGPTATAAAPASTVAVTSAPAAAVVPTAAPDDGRGSPVWPWVVGAVVLVGGGVVAALRLGRG